LSTDDACALLRNVLGIDPVLDGNMLKMLRMVERAHGILPPNGEAHRKDAAGGLSGGADCSAAT